MVLVMECNIKKTGHVEPVEENMLINRIYSTPAGQVEFDRV